MIFNNLIDYVGKIFITMAGNVQKIPPHVNNYKSAKNTKNNCVNAPEIIEWQAET